MSVEGKQNKKHGAIEMNKSFLFGVCKLGTPAQIKTSKSVS